MDLRHELTRHLPKAGIEHYDRMVLGLSVKRLVYQHLVIRLGLFEISEAEGLSETTATCRRRCNLSTVE